MRILFFVIFSVFFIFGGTTTVSVPDGGLWQTLKELDGYSQGHVVLELDTGSTHVFDYDSMSSNYPAFTIGDTIRDAVDTLASYPCSSLTIKAVPVPASPSEMPVVEFIASGSSEKTGWQIKQDNFTLEGLNLKGNTGFSGMKVLKVTDSLDNFKVRRCLFTSSSSYSGDVTALYMDKKPDSLLVENSVFYDIYDCIDASGSSNSGTRTGWRIVNTTAYNVEGYFLMINNNDSLDKLEDVEIINSVVYSSSNSGSPFLVTDTVRGYTLDNFVSYNYDYDPFTVDDTTYYDGFRKKDSESYFQFTKDPRFKSVSLSSSDFMMPDTSASANSVLINNGTSNAPSGTGAYGLFGENRKISSSVDIGARESEGTFTVDETAPSVKFNLTADGDTSEYWDHIILEFDGTHTGGKLTDSLDADSLYVFWRLGGEFEYIPPGEYSDSRGWQITSNTTSFTDTLDDIFLFSDTLYYFAACIVDSSGNRSELTSSVNDTARTDTPPASGSTYPYFKRPFLSASVISQDSILLEWEEDSVGDPDNICDSIGIWWDEGQTYSAAEDSFKYIFPGTESYGIGGLDPKTHYTFAAVPHSNEYGEWHWSSSKTITARTDPDTTPPVNNMRISIENQSADIRREDCRNLVDLTISKPLSFDSDAWIVSVYYGTSAFSGKSDTGSGHAVTSSGDICKYPLDPDTTDTLTPGDIPDKITLEFSGIDTEYFIYMSLMDIDSNLAYITDTCSLSVTTSVDDEYPAVSLSFNAASSATDSSRIPVTLYKSAAYDPDVDSIIVRYSSSGYPGVFSGTLLFSVDTSEINSSSGPYYDTASGLQHLTDYYFTAFISDSSDNWTACDSFSLKTLDKNDIYPANLITDMASGSVDTASIEIIYAAGASAWSDLTDSTDFRYLLLYKSESGYVFDHSGAPVRIDMRSSAPGSYDFTGLNENTGYYFSAFIEDSSGNVYSGSGDIAYFDTLFVMTSEDNNPPSPVVSFF
ncbi:MAG: hypothetical protein ACLFQK_07415, partial [Fibrobacterota bacterium]